MTTPKHVKERVAKNPKRNPNGKGGGSDTKYKKMYCDMLIKHMEQGFSFTSFGADVNCGSKTLYNWCDNHPEFKIAKGIGQEKAKKFFEQIARLKVLGKKVKTKSGEEIDPKRSDTAMLIFFLKTRFREEYTEKIEVEQQNTNYNINFVEESND